MPRFTNTATGVVVSVDEATAAQLGAEWSPVGGGVDSDDTKIPEPKTRARRTK